VTECERTPRKRSRPTSTAKEADASRTWLGPRSKARCSPGRPQQGVGCRAGARSQRVHAHPRFRDRRGREDPQRVVPAPSRRRGLPAPARAPRLVSSLAAAAPAGLPQSARDRRRTDRGSATARGSPIAFGRAPSLKGRPPGWKLQTQAAGALRRGRCSGGSRCLRDVRAVSRDRSRAGDAALGLRNGTGTCQPRAGIGAAAGSRRDAATQPLPLVNSAVGAGSHRRALDLRAVGWETRWGLAAAATGQPSSTISLARRSRARLVSAALAWDTEASWCVER